MPVLDDRAARHTTSSRCRACGAIRSLIQVQPCIGDGIENRNLAFRLHKRRMRHQGSRGERRRSSSGGTPERAQSSKSSRNFDVVSAMAILAGSAA